MTNKSFLFGSQIKDRFRGFLPVVVDIETGGIDPNVNPLLEMCIVLLEKNAKGHWQPKTTHFEHILPFEGAHLDQNSLNFLDLDPFQPLRFAIEEKPALEKLFSFIKKDLENFKCKQAVLVGHNAWFDLLFIKEAVKRNRIDCPFHSFTCFDTATLAGMVYGQTVLAKAAHAAGISFDVNEAHSAIYDAEKTAELFCTMINYWHDLHLNP